MPEIKDFILKNGEHVTIKDETARNNIQTLSTNKLDKPTTNGTSGQALTIDDNGEIVWGDISGNSSSGSSSSEESNIQVFRSTDFEPFTYVSGNTTYYCPRVTFPGSANGKILAIRAVDANGKTHSLDPLNLMHFGANIFSPQVDAYHYGSSPYYWLESYFEDINNSSGITITYLGDGGYRVQGTAKSNARYVIGSVYEKIWGGLTILNTNTYIKCFNIQGTYGNLNIGIGYNNNYRTPIDTPMLITAYSKYNDNHAYALIYLYTTANETYDCTFYPQVTPTINDAGSLTTYERPFILLYGTGSSSNTIQNMTPILEKNGIPEKMYFYSASSSYSASSISVYLNSHYGNASNFGVIDYPIIHSGKNTFVYDNGANTDANNLLVLEVYYDPNYQYSAKDAINEVEYSISNGHFNKYAITCSCIKGSDASYYGLPDTTHVWFGEKWNEVPFIKKRSPYIPKGIYLMLYSSSYGVSGPPHSMNEYKRSNNFDINYFENYNDMSSGSYMIGKTSSLKYYRWYSLSSEIVFTSGGSNVGAIYGIPSPTSMTSMSIAKILPDWDGWDDSPTFQQ